MRHTWAQRAAQAETAILRRHHRRLWQLPGTRLGVVGWPPTAKDRAFGSWHYWWQAHLLDTLVDAQLREPRTERVNAITRQIRGHRTRNLGRWTNSYYDDMAWLALALERAGRVAGVGRPRALRTLAAELTRSWMPDAGGGIPWRKQDRFFNAPANGPAGIFLARYGNLRRAQQMADWIEDTLIDPQTHLVFDGIKGGSLVRAQYTYCQGVVVGLETELAVRTSDERHAPRVRRLVAAIDQHTWHRAGFSPARAAATAVCSRASPPAIWPWRPQCFPVSVKRAAPHGASSSPLHRPPGTIDAASTASPCSAPPGATRPSSPSQPSAPESPMAPCTVRRSPNAICPFRFRDGCCWRPRTRYAHRQQAM